MRSRARLRAAPGSRPCASAAGVALANVPRGVLTGRARAVADASSVAPSVANQRQSAAAARAATNGAAAMAGAPPGAIPAKGVRQAARQRHGRLAKPVEAVDQ